MYIKIKHIKLSLLVFLCLFFGSINYLNYVKADTAAKNASCDRSIDSDCDGLTNTEEALYGTNPNNPDTDGDGYSDGVEVKSGYNPLKPAPGDKIVAATTDSSQANSATTNSAQNTALTDNLTDKLKTFIDSKGSESISNTDLNNFISENISDVNSQHITVDSLPQVDISAIKILPQNYSSLSADERKNKMQKDALTYYSKIAYILASNSPVIIESSADFNNFLSDLQTHFSTLTSTNPDTEYFLDIANRANSFINQANEIEVPQSMLDLHVKAQRIIKGFLELQNSGLSLQDPIAKIALISKIQDLILITEDFFNTDLQNYNNSLK